MSVKTNVTVPSGRSAIGEQRLHCLLGREPAATRPRRLERRRRGGKHLLCVAVTVRPEDPAGWLLRLGRAPCQPGGFGPLLLRRDEGGDEQRVDDVHPVIHLAPQLEL